MGVLRFDIRHPNGERELAEVEGERAIIGSASHCDVRLPIDQAAYEHLIVEVHAGTVRVHSKAASPPATVNGMPLTETVVTPEAMLGLGQVRLFIVYVPDTVEGDSSAAKGKQESSLLLRLIVLIGLPLGGYLLLAPDAASIEPPPRETPQLFAAAPTKCPADTPAQAFSLAREKLDLAGSKQERLPFALEEGAAAVPLYEQAAACLVAAHSTSAAQEVTQVAQSLRKTVELEFRTRTLRVERMIAVGDLELVQHDVKILGALVKGKKGPFVNWLATIRRQLRSQGVLK